MCTLQIWVRLVWELCQTGLFFPWIIIIFAFFSVQPNKEIKIVSAVRRSSITSLAGNSNPYFSVTPTLVFPPVAECNPKSGRGFCTSLLLLRVRLFPLGMS